MVKMGNHQRSINWVVKRGKPLSKKRNLVLKKSLLTLLSCMLNVK